VSPECISWVAPLNIHAFQPTKYQYFFYISQTMTCFTRSVLQARSIDAIPTPPADFGVKTNPWLILWREVCVPVACCHRNCFCMLTSCLTAQLGMLKTATVNRIAGSIMKLSSVTLFSMHVATCVAVQLPS